MKKTILLISVFCITLLLACEDEQPTPPGAQPLIDLDGFVTLHDTCWGFYVDPVFDITVDLYKDRTQLIASTITDLEVDGDSYYGTFIFEDIAPGYYELTFSKAGFASTYLVDTFIQTSSVYKQMIPQTQTKPIFFGLDSMVVAPSQPGLFEINYRVSTTPLNACEQLSAVTFFGDSPAVSPDNYIDSDWVLTNQDGFGNGSAYGAYERYEGNTIYAITYTQVPAEIDARRYFDAERDRIFYFGLSNQFVKAQFAKGY